MRLNVLADDKRLANGANAPVLDQDSCHRLPPRIGRLRIVSLVCNTLSLFQRPAQAGLSQAWLLPALVRIAALGRWSPSCSRRLLSQHAHQPSTTPGSRAELSPKIGAKKEVILPS